MQNINTVAEDLQERLGKYARVKHEALCSEIETHAKELKKLISSRSPVGRRMKYSKSWKTKNIALTNSRCVYAVYSAKEYPLTHLLERGHATRNGGRTQPQVHIKNSKEEIEKKYISNIEKNNSK